MDRPREGGSGTSIGSLKEIHIRRRYCESGGGLLRQRGGDKANKLSDRLWGDSIIVNMRWHQKGINPGYWEIA